MFAPQSRYPAPTPRLSCWGVGSVAVAAVPASVEHPTAIDPMKRVGPAALHFVNPTQLVTCGKDGRAAWTNRIPHRHPSTRSKEGDRRCTRLCPDERPQGGRQPLGRHGRGTARPGQRRRATRRRARRPERPLAPGPHILARTSRAGSTSVTTTPSPTGRPCAPAPSGAPSHRHPELCVLRPVGRTRSRQRDVRRGLRHLRLRGVP